METNKENQNKSRAFAKREKQRIPPTSASVKCHKDKMISKIKDLPKIQLKENQNGKVGGISVQKKLEAALLLKDTELVKLQHSLIVMERNLGKVEDERKNEKERFNSQLQKQHDKIVSLELRNSQLVTAVVELKRAIIPTKGNNIQNTPCKNIERGGFMETSTNETEIVLEQASRSTEKDKNITKRLASVINDLGEMIENPSSTKK